MPPDEDCPSYKFGACLNGGLDGDPGEGGEPYVSRLPVYVTRQWWDGKDDGVVCRDVGTSEGYIFRVGLAIHDGIWIVEEADGVDAEAYEYCTAVIRPKRNSWLESVERQFNNELFDHDVWALSEMKIEPEHRGRKLGLRLPLRTMQMFGSGCGLTILKPWPLRHGSGEFEQIAKDGVRRKTIQKRPLLRFAVVRRESFAAALPDRHRFFPSVAREVDRAIS